MTTFESLTSSKSNQWNTPPGIIESARYVMGSIDCDAATNEYAQRWIKAPVWYDGSSLLMNGLIQPWFRPLDGIKNVWLNPPYGDLSKPFCNKALREWQIYRHLDCQMIILVRGDNEGLDGLLTHCNIWLRSQRIKFIPSPELEAELKSKALKKGKVWNNSPVPGSMVIYFGHKQDRFVEKNRRNGLLFPPAIYVN